MKQVTQGAIDNARDGLIFYGFLLNTSEFRGRNIDAPVLGEEIRKTYCQDEPRNKFYADCFANLEGFILEWNPYYGAHSRLARKTSPLPCSSEWYTGAPKRDPYDVD